MATEEDIYRIIQKVEGDEKVKALADDLANAEQKLRDVIQAGGKMSQSAKDWAGEMARVSAQMKAVQAESGLASHKIMQLGQTVDDLQYVGEQGLRPIINNVMQLSPQLGIALIAVQLLYSNWDNLANLFGMGHVKTQAEEMEELRKKTSLTADEAERLARATAVGEKVKELRGGQGKEEKQAEDAVSRAIVEAGPGNVARGVLKVAPELVDRQGDAAIAKQKLADLEKKLESTKKLHASDTTGSSFVEAGKLEEQIRDAKKGLSDARRKTAEELAATGALPSLFPGGRAQLQGLVEKDPDAFGPKGNQLRRDLAEADPAARARKEADEQDARAQMQEQEWQAKKFQSEREAQESRQADADKADERAAKDEEDWRNRKVQWEKQSQEEAKKQALDKAKETPGIEDAIRAQLKAMGGGPQAVEATTRQLQGRFGREAAEKLVGDQAVGARDELMRDFVQGPDTEKRRNSQVIGAEGLAASIQSAVGGDDTAKKSLEQLQRQTAILEAISRQRGVGGGGDVVVRANGNLGVN